MNDYSNGRGLKEHSISTQSNGLPAKEPWLVQVDLFLDSVHPLKFHIESCLPQKWRNIGGKKEKYLVFDNYGRFGFRIIFQLHDPTNSGYTFPKKPDDAVWSHKKDECPTAYCEDKVFKPVRVIEPDQTTLVVDFPNQEDIGDFRYTFNLVKSGAAPLQLDPGGTGNNNNNN